MQVAIVGLPRQHRLAQHSNACLPTICPSSEICAGHGKAENSELVPSGSPHQGCLEPRNGSA